MVLVDVVLFVCVPVCVSPPFRLLVCMYLRGNYQPVPAHCISLDQQPRVGVFERLIGSGDLYSNHHHCSSIYVSKVVVCVCVGAYIEKRNFQPTSTYMFRNEILAS